jgi:hypothetical protein
VWGRQKLTRQPLLAFFSISFLITFILIAGWAIYYGQFPPPELLP